MKIRKFSLFAATVVLLSLSSFAKSRPGADVVLTLKDSRVIKGELYAVKSDAVIIVDVLGDSATLAVADVSRIKLKKSTRRAVRTGAIIGFGTGAIIGFFGLGVDDELGILECAGGAALIGLVTALPCAVAGRLAGEIGKYKTYTIEGLSGEALQKVLSQLRKNARAPALR